MKCCRLFIYNSNKGDFYSAHIPHKMEAQGTLQQHSPRTHMHTCKLACILAHRQGNRHSCEMDSLEKDY